jgi:hypothetical protein
VISTVLNLSRPAGLAALVGFALVKVATQPVVVGRPATIVFAPWVGGAEAIARATVGARLLARGGTAFAVTVIPERADYAATLSGAWLVTGLVSDQTTGQAGCASPARGAARS